MMNNTKYNFLFLFFHSTNAGGGKILEIHEIHIIASVKKFNEELIRCFIQRRHAIEREITRIYIFYVLKQSKIEKS